MVDVRRVKLPGVGVLHTFISGDGGKVGVITHRSGHSDLIAFADADEVDDGNKVSLRLDEDEAHTLAELLGGTRITEAISGIDEIPGLSIDWFHVDYEDHIAGQPLGNMASRGLPGVTVVAIVRSEAANPVPAEDFKVFPGDTLVVAGSPEKVAKAFQFYRTGEVKAKTPTTAIPVQDSPPGE